MGKRTHFWESTGLMTIYQDANFQSRYIDQAQKEKDSNISAYTLQRYLSGIQVT